MDRITASGINGFLENSFEITVKETTKSTNYDVKQLALEGKDEYSVVIANEQTMGRGRMGRSFFSPGNSGIYMSLLLKPFLKTNAPLLITTAAAVATAVAIDEIMGISTRIKWVNDIYYNNKKICGILAEAITMPGESFVVLGIGINVYPPASGFPEEIINKAGFITENESDGLKNRIIARVLDNFYRYYQALEKKEFYEIYKSKNMLKDKMVELPSGEKVRAVDIDKSFCLVAEKADKSVLTLMTGEVIINL